MDRRLLTFLAILCCAIGCDARRSETPARTLKIAAAANVKFAMDELIREFETLHPGIRVTATYGSSGNFYSQLSSKAPFDLFFSADAEYPQKLVDSGLASKDSMFTYATGRIVIWVQNGSLVDVVHRGIEALTAPSIRKIAIANPQHAPYGRAAEEAMKKLGVYDRVKDKLVLGENIAQAAQFVESGAADIGIIALSLAEAPAMKQKGRYWLVPGDAHTPLAQAAATMSWATDPGAARTFCDFVSSANGRAILLRYGFATPGE